MTHREQIAYRVANELVADGWIDPLDLYSLRNAEDILEFVHNCRKRESDMALYAADNPAIVALVEALRMASVFVAIEGSNAEFEQVEAALAPWVKEKV